jgi:trigger factor
MKITKKELLKNQVELKIEVEVKEYQSFLEKTAQEMSTNAKIQGFRPGKAPYDIIKQKFGEMKIFEQALDSILTHFYFEAVTKEKIEPISHPKVDIEKMVVENPLIFKATINLIPSIKLCELDKINVKKTKVEIGDKEVEKAIETLRENQAKEVLEDKGIEKNDKADVNFEVSIDGVVIEGGKETNYPLVIGKGHMIPGFEENLMDKKKGDKVEFKLKFPEKYHNPNVANKEGEFKVEIKAVYKRELPKVDDKWAQTTLHTKDLEDLKNKIKENYKADKKRQEDKKIEMEIIEKIIKASEIGDFSDDLIKSETQKMIEELKQNIEKQGLKFEDYLNQLGKKVTDMEKDFKEQADKRLKSSLIMKAVIDQEKIEITDKEIDSEIETAKKMYSNDTEMIKNLESNHYKEHLRLGLLNKKVMDYLKEKCSS